MLVDYIGRYADSEEKTGVKMEGIPESQSVPSCEFNWSTQHTTILGGIDRYFMWEPQLFT